MPLNPKRFWWWFNLIDQATFLRTQESKKQGLLKKRPSDNTNFIYKEQRNECLKAGRDWGQEEKGTTEDETAGWHHQLYGHEFEWTPGVGDGQGGRQCLPLEKAMAPHSSTLAWKIPWMEEPGMLQSMGSLRVGHDWATSLWLFTFMHWKRKWQLTPVFLPGESHGQRSLVGCRLWGHTELDTTEVT